MYKGTFEANLPKYNRYIKATQNAIVRLDPQTTPNEVEGLCTDRVRACVGFIFIGKTNSRISLIHTDLAVKEETILQESQWVGYPCQLTMIRGCMYIDKQYETTNQLTTKFLPRLNKLLKENYVGIELISDSYLAKSGAFIVNRQGVIELIDKG